MSPVIVKSRAVRAVSLFFPVAAISLWPFVFVHPEKVRIRLLRHEAIHFQQALETLVIPFYILYLVNFIVNLFRYKTAKRAYREILAEREAYAHEYEDSYLATRRRWAWLFQRKAS